jgi:hypothetical protein
MEAVMDMIRLARRYGPVIMAALLVVVFLVAANFLVKPAYTQQENIDVSCYQGNTEEGNYIGNLTVTTPQNAGQDCNSTYYGCQGQCLGCFPDSDFTEDVCYDNNGRRFLK